ncbi:MAG: multiheme c-type cytochrome, partial [SAR324 cluster bacterium]
GSSRQAPGDATGSSRQALGDATGSSRQALGNGPGWHVDPLTREFPDGPEALAALKVYDGRVKALFFEQMAARESQAKNSPFVGAFACQACHAAEFAVWQSSPHSHALQGLEKVGKQFDPECLECHVVGVSQGGFVSADITPQLAAVQCESCHGPGRTHVEDPAKVKMTALGTGSPQPGEATCRTCHRGAHSPKFAFPAYWARIVHGTPTAQH